jgi:hypothetical protein
LDADNRSGTILTKPFQWPKGKRLHLNTDASDGTVHVNVIAASGKTISNIVQSKPVAGDPIDATVTWPKTEPVVPDDQPIRLRFMLKHAKLYAFWFAAD